MAKVVSPLHSDRAKGSVGGVTYSVARGLDTVKAKPSPSQPRSARQLAVRAILSTCSRAWANLSDANRSAWDDFAALDPQYDWTGRTYYLSGFTEFVRFTSLMLDMGLAQVDTPPAVAAPGSPALFAAANGVLQSVVTWTSPGGTATQMDIWHLGPISKGRAAKIEHAVHNCYLTAETATKTVTGLTAGRHWFWGRFISETDGQFSPMVMDYADITAV